MFVEVFAEIGAAERDFESIAIYDVQLLPKCDLSYTSLTLDAPSRSFCTRKQQSLNENVGQLVFIKAGKICSFFE